MFFKHYAIYGGFITVGLMLAIFAAPDNLQVPLLVLQIVSLSAQIISCWALWRSGAL